jgi:hypothetical protein
MSDGAGGSLRDHPGHCPKRLRGCGGFHKIAQPAAGWSEAKSGAGCAISAPFTAWPVDHRCRFAPSGYLHWRTLVVAPRGLSGLRTALPRSGQPCVRSVRPQGLPQGRPLHHYTSHKFLSGAPDHALACRRHLISDAT